MAALILPLEIIRKTPSISRFIKYKALVDWFTQQKPYPRCENASGAKSTLIVLLRVLTFQGIKNAEKKIIVIAYKYLRALTTCKIPVAHRV